MLKQNEAENAVALEESDEASGGAARDKIMHQLRELNAEAGDLHATRMLIDCLASVLGIYLAHYGRDAAGEVLLRLGQYTKLYSKYEEAEAERQAAGVQFERLN